VGAKVLVVMGVSGVGKTTIGQRIARALGWPFYDGDDYHPEANKRKMNAGQPLDDADRQEWLGRLRALIQGCLAEDRPAVVACSALKAAYRDVLARTADGAPSPGVVFVYLKAPPSVVRRRISGRTGHFMNPALLESQYAALEEPRDTLVVDATQRPAAVVAAVLAAVQETGPAPS
jgi:gluconokinase